ncbi:Protein kinase-like (PK-like) [Glarea lozoyensis ATCC 20868]|uniref:Protein kinase-like (PK-like) n=2 Tax=Glarea lozoyensis TaxID=101852 RepID=S3DGB9_GLAL2|nr:Protein kinase-like (PK-like) [Glarea lozoyensis ATCC 20868]EHK99255.1 hypothetical protein M7I_4941 [Glarea lozoyensis 74030]EPE36740.1 Protein kinase-like (PK-like) [Glarea lozoyensis ATCC 20868]
MENTQLARKVARDKREFDNTYHPGLDAADLVHFVHDLKISEPESIPKAEGYEDPRDIDSERVLCHNCGWTGGNETSSYYTSRLKVMYAHRNSCIWELSKGGPWLLKDYPNQPQSPCVKDYVARQFVREKAPSVPIPESFKFDGVDNKFTFEMMARAKGVRFSEAIDNGLSDQDNLDVNLDLAEHIKQWRKITSPRMGGINGTELLDSLIGNCTGWGCINTGANEEDWLENLTPGLKKGLLWPSFRHKEWREKDEAVLESWSKKADEEIAELKANFPKGGPYVLTHCDLNADNIFISNDNKENKWKVSAIIDWELAGFYPWWVEVFRGDFWGVLSDTFLTETESEKLKNIREPVEKVRQMWEYGGGISSSSKHGLDANNWFRKPFCACYPHVGNLKENMLGLDDQGHLDIFDVDSEVSDSEFDEEADKDKHFDRRARLFQRWINKISKKTAEE